MKRRTLTLTLCILACIALIGVGFASWVITYDQNDEVTGNVNVDTISDVSHVITIVNKASINDVVFGAAEDNDVDSKHWLTVPTVNCNLVIKFEVTITNPADLDSTPIKVELTETNGSYYSAAAEANYVVALDEITPTINKIEDASTENGNIAKYEVTITFAWGNAFDGKNPTQYYNANEATPELVADAKAKLNSEVFKNLGEAQFKITVSTNKKLTA